MIPGTQDELLLYVKEHMQATLPVRLYKFREMKGGALESIIRTRSLRFSNPLSWNDPFDGQIRIDTNNTQGEIARYLKFHQPKIHRARARELGKQVANNNAKWHDYLNQLARERISMQGFCCFTSDWSPILQWSYYADGHKGVALGFKPSEDLDLFGLPLEVKYVEEYPFLNYVNQSLECLSALLTAKSKVWAHEQEIRIWRSPPGDHPFKPTALADITFGARCSAEQIRKVRSWCTLAGLTHIQFYQANTATRKFIIERSEIS